jgi:hypothetical protein
VVLAREPPGDPAAERWQGGPFAVAEALPNPAASKKRPTRRRRRKT